LRTTIIRWLFTMAADLQQGLDATMKTIAGAALWKWVALAASIALLVIAVLAAGSTQAVATVDGHAITLATYQDWLKAAAVSTNASNSAIPPFVPDAPGYPRCMSFERAVAAKSGVKTPPSVATLRTACSQIRVTLAEEVMQFMLSGQWFLDQAARENVTVSPQEVQRALHSSFPKTTGLTQFLSSNGLSRSDLEFEARAALLAGKLTDRHSGPTPTITSAQIASYYDANRSQIGNETLAQATPAIRQALISSAQAPTFNAWLSTVQRYYQPRTICARGYRIAFYCARGS
jgi:hypothetical protein